MLLRSDSTHARSQLSGLVSLAKSLPITLAGVGSGATDLELWLTLIQPTPTGKMQCGQVIIGGQALNEVLLLAAVLGDRCAPPRWQAWVGAHAQRLSESRTHSLSTHRDRCLLGCGHHSVQPRTSCACGRSSAINVDPMLTPGEADFDSAAVGFRPADEAAPTLRLDVRRMCDVICVILRVQL